MGRTVDELLDSISYSELISWGAYYRVEPWGEWRADVRSAQIATILANVNRDQKKKPEPYTIKDMMLFGTKDEEQQQQVAESGEGAKMDPALIGWLFGKSGATVEEK